MVVNLKSAVFGTSLSSPLLVTECGGLVCENICKVDLLSEHFDSTQYMEAVDLPLTCHPSPYSLTKFTLRSREIRYLLLDLNPYGSLNHLV